MFRLGLDGDGMECQIGVYRPGSACRVVGAGLGGPGLSNRYGVALHGLSQGTVGPGSDCHMASIGMEWNVTRQGMDWFGQVWGVSLGWIGSVWLVCRDWLGLGRHGSSRGLARIVLSWNVVVAWQGQVWSGTESLFGSDSCVMERPSG